MAHKIFPGIRSSAQLRTGDDRELDLVPKVDHDQCHRYTQMFATSLVADEALIHKQEIKKGEINVSLMCDVYCAPYAGRM